MRPFSKNRLWLLLAVPLALSLTVAALPGRKSTASVDIVRYTMTAFTNSSETDMYVYESGDATGFHPLAGRAYKPPTGLVRDPSMFRHSDGFYYLVYTTGWDGDTIGFARSRDRVNWTFVRNYRPLPGAAHTWAPVWFVDPRGHVDIIVSISTGGDFTPYLLSSADPSLASWSAPIPLAGIGTNHIDTVLVRTGMIYHAFTKNETTKFVEHAVAFDPAGPYLMVATGDWAGWGVPREGPSLIRLENGGWRIFLDGYTVGKYYYSDSFDGFVTWTPPRELPILSGIVRHFTVLAETG